MKRVVLVRVDDRLIHGQIIEAWVPYTKANTVLIIDEELSKDDFKRSIIESSCPRSLLVKIEDIKDGVAYLSGAETGSPALKPFPSGGFKLNKWLRRGQIGGERIIVIFADLKTALMTYRTGFHFKELNLGNIHTFKEIKGVVDFNHDIKALSPSVFIDELDVEVISELRREGVLFDIRAVPSDKSLKPVLNLFQCLS